MYSEKISNCLRRHRYILLYVDAHSSAAKKCKYFEITDGYCTTPNLRFITYTLKKHCDNIIVEMGE